jgi:hypothetical protein
MICGVFSNTPLPHFAVTDTSSRSTMETAQDLAVRYVSIWNETELAARRSGIAKLWRPDSMHLSKAHEAKGYAALEQRIIGSHRKNVRDKDNKFRARPGAQRIRDVVTFTWEMVPAEREDMLAVGLEFLVLDAEGRIAITSSSSPDFARALDHERPLYAEELICHVNT